jgi:hypothetical protein
MHHSSITRIGSLVDNFMEQKHRQGVSISKTNMEEQKFTWDSGGITDLFDVAGGHEEPMTYVNCFDIIICHGTLV